MSDDVRADALPVDALLPELAAYLAAQRRVVLSAPPGSGKTTRVPPALLRSKLMSAGQRLILTQPRRLAARAVARYMAARMDEPVGRTVGYKVRFDERACAATRLLVVTEGVLARMLLSDPLLDGVGCVVLDEFHERSVQADLSLAFLQETLEARDDLGLVVMSATLEAAPLCRYLGDAPHLRAEARQHPLTVRHQPRQADPRRPLAQRVAAALPSLLAEAEGDVLVFLPGAPEIRRAAEALAAAKLPGAPELLPLYGALPPEAQDRALRPPGPGQRRVILSTNIAETSLTVPGVRAVLDTGLRKRMRHDPRAGIDRLELCPTSQASADQRAGRAGRLGPGVALRLYTEQEHSSRPARDAPEVTLVDLSPVLLSAMAFRPGDPAEFPFLDPPPAGEVARALGLLRQLGAVAPDGFTLTDLGQQLSALPLHPRLGALMHAAHARGRARQGALLAALLAERDPLARDHRGDEQMLPDGDSDLLHRAELMEQWEQRGAKDAAARRLGLHPGGARGVLRARDQIHRLVRARWPASKGAEGAELTRALLHAYPDRLCRRRAPGAREAVMVGGAGVRLSAGSGVRQAPLFLALRVSGGVAGTGARATVSVASVVREAWLEQELPHCLAVRREVVFDPARGAALGVRRRCFEDLVLDEARDPDADPAQVSEALAREAARRFDEVFRPDRAGRQLMARIALAARELVDQCPWPEVAEEAGRRALLQAQCQGRHGLDELRGLDWAAALRGLLTHQQVAALKRHLPEKIAVPSGRQVTLDYEPALAPGAGPVLAVKLQEMFGLADGPRLCMGRVPVVLHLLAPNGRPAQITTDLASFWSSSYALVRKDLRGRYPKHPWPEDPLSAQPTARTKRRR